MNKIGSRIETFDVWKGIIIFLVVLGHAAGGIIHSVPLSFEDEGNAVVVLFHFIYSFHMPAFFLIAGVFSSSWLKKSFNLALRDKIKRLMIPYFIWGFILASAMQVAGGYTNGGLGLKEYLWSPVIPFSEYWFLYVLFFVHWLYYAISHLVKMETEGKYVFLVMASVLYIIKPWMPAFWISASLCQYTIYFAIGAVASQVLHSLVCHTKPSLYKLGCGVLAFIGINIIFLHFMIHESDSSYPVLSWYLGFFIAFINTVASLFLSIYLEHLIAIIKTILSFWGRYSMEIYCTHLLVLSSMRILVLKIVGKQVDYWGFMWEITLFTMIVLSIVLYKFPKNYKVYKVVFGLK